MEHNSENNTPITSFFDDYRFLSNFWKHEIIYEGITYPSNEHAYQAAKTDDIAERLKIAALDSPGKAKRYGKTVELVEGWDYNKIQVMHNLVTLKFSHGSNLATLLLKTGDSDIIEGNTWGDTFWGVCNGKGRNHLGKILMGRRETLKLQRILDNED